MQSDYQSWREAKCHFKLLDWGELLWEGLLAVRESDFDTFEQTTSWKKNLRVDRTAGSQVNVAADLFMIGADLFIYHLNVNLLNIFMSEWFVAVLKRIKKLPVVCPTRKDVVLSLEHSARHAFAPSWLCSVKKGASRVPSAHISFVASGKWNLLR